MESEFQVDLPTNATVTLYAEESNFPDMLTLVSGTDFIKETEIIRQTFHIAPCTLVVYDNFLAFGTLFSNGLVKAEIRPYTQGLLIDRIDAALSMRKEPIRVIDKTSVQGIMALRLEERLSLNWIEYKRDQEVLCERAGFPCDPKRYIESMPACKDLFSLFPFNDKIEVIHMRINDKATKVENGLHYEGIRCEGLGKERYDGTIDSVFRSFLKTEPNALIVREPLSYCSMGCEIKPYSCLAHIFEEEYVRKKGLITSHEMIA